MLRRLLLAITLPCLARSQSLVMVGGGLSDFNTAIWDKVVELAGGRGVARIGVFGAASADPQGSADYYIDMFVNVYGAQSAVFIPITETSGNANDQAMVDLILQQTGFFFGGGDQARVTRALKNPDGSDTLALAALKTVFQGGAVAGGSSAGMACLGKTFMITGGNSYEGLLYGAHPGGEDPDNTSNLSYNEFGGIGLIEGYVLDTHFAERGREARLIRLLQDTKDAVGGVARGIGADEDMALVVYNVGSDSETGEVVGTAGGVFVVDVSAAVSNPSATVDYRNVVTAFLTSGDKIDMRTGAVTFASWKSPLKGNELNANAVSSSDILSSQKSGQFRATATGLFDNSQDSAVTSYSRESRPVEFTVVMNRSFGTAYVGNLPDGTRVISHIDLYVDIYESVNKE